MNGRPNVHLPGHCTAEIQLPCAYHPLSGADDRSRNAAWLVQPVQQWIGMVLAAEYVPAAYVENTVAMSAQSAQENVNGCEGQPGKLLAFLRSAKN
mmetsp:Transcript_62903/g.99851  ORF Transcript_62903/g.99851 Transcript_62903/m.99851 type:complete len:96 (+) Transcript_62903:294-581(+)